MLEIITDQFEVNWQRLTRLVAVFGLRQRWAPSESQLLLLSMALSTCHSTDPPKCSIQFQSEPGLTESSLEFWNHLSMPRPESSVRRNTTCSTYRGLFSLFDNVMKTNLYTPETWGKGYANQSVTSRQAYVSEIKHLKKERTKFEKVSPGGSSGVPWRWIYVWCLFPTDWLKTDYPLCSVLRTNHFSLSLWI